MSEEQICALVTVEQMLAAMHAFYYGLLGSSEGPLARLYDTPLRSAHRLQDSSGGTKILGLMPSVAHRPGRQDVAFFGCKTLAVQHAAGTAASRHTGVYTLFSGETMAPLCTMDAGALTALRTAASSAVAATFLMQRIQASEASEHGAPRALHVAVVGTGVQALRHAVALVQAFLATPTPVESLTIWGRDRGRAQACAQRCRTELAGTMASVPHIAGAVLGADGLSRAQLVVLVTSSSSPVVSAEDLFAAQQTPCTKALVAVGACTPSCREFGEDVLELCALPIVVDSAEGVAAEAGEFRLGDAAGVLARLGPQALPRFVALSDATCAQTKLEPSNNNRVLLFKSVGFGALDLMAAQLVYQNGQHRGLL